MQRHRRRASAQSLAPAFAARGAKLWAAKPLRVRVPTRRGVPRYATPGCSAPRLRRFVMVPRCMRASSKAVSQPARLFRSASLTPGGPRTPACRARVRAPRRLAADVRVDALLEGGEDEAALAGDLGGARPRRATETIATHLPSRPKQALTRFVSGPDLLCPAAPFVPAPLSSRRAFKTSLSNRAGNMGPRFGGQSEWLPTKARAAPLRSTRTPHASHT